MPSVTTVHDHYFCVWNENYRTAEGEGWGVAGWIGEGLGRSGFFGGVGFLGGLGHWGMKTSGSR